MSQRLPHVQQREQHQGDHERPRGDEDADVAGDPDDHCHRYTHDGEDASHADERDPARGSQSACRRLAGPFPHCAVVEHDLEHAVKTLRCQDEAEVANAERAAPGREPRHLRRVAGHDRGGQHPRGSANRAGRTCSHGRTIRR